MSSAQVSGSIDAPAGRELNSFFRKIREVAPEALQDLPALLSFNSARQDQLRVAASHALASGGFAAPGHATQILNSVHVSTPVEVHPSGVRSSRIGRLVVVLLPEFRSLSHRWDVLDVINRLYINSDPETEWLLDCSSICEPETLLLSSLLGYERELRLQGRRIRLAWLREEFIPEPLQQRFETLFDLVKRAGHYFSR